MSAALQKIALPEKHPAEGAWDFPAPLTGAVFVDDVPVATDGDGNVHAFVDGGFVTHKIHDGASLTVVVQGDSVLSGGDDGKLVRFFPYTNEVRIVAEQKGQWIEHVAAHESGLVAYAYGKKAQLLKNDEPLGSVYEHPSTVGGLAFQPKGKRLAVSHYNGVSVWWANGSQQVPQVYKWAGSHLGITWHPTDDIVITALQEAALHGWRLKDGEEMRMQGYVAKIRSMEWMDNGRYLVTGGAEQAIAWPFFGGGPWGKAPSQFGPPVNFLVQCVCVHPSDPLVALGYENGMLALVPLTEEAPLKLLDPTGTAFSSLSWNEAGTTLAAATAAGRLYFFTLASVGKAFGVQG